MAANASKASLHHKGGIQSGPTPVDLRALSNCTAPRPARSSSALAELIELLRSVMTVSKPYAPPPTRPSGESPLPSGHPRFGENGGAERRSRVMMSMSCSTRDVLVGIGVRQQTQRPQVGHLDPNGQDQSATGSTADSGGPAHPALASANPAATGSSAERPAERRPAVGVFPCT